MKIKNTKGLTKLEPSNYFKDANQVARALLQCLIDGDHEAYMEILDSFLRVNRKNVAEKSNLSRSTIQQAFSDKGNPTIKTIAKIVHESARKPK